MFAGGAAGAAGAAANNGNVLQGMLTGAVGGMMTMSQGGRFAHGFAAAGIGSFGGGGSTPAGFIRGAVLGGIASEVTGGKFKNGAATAAFMWALRAGASRLSPNEDVEGDYGYRNSNEMDEAIESLEDNIRRNSDGQLVLEASVSAGEGAENLRRVFLEKVNGTHHGKQKGFLWWKDGREESLIVNLSEHNGPGEGDIHIVTRDVMNNRSPEAIAYANANPRACASACAARERNWIGIGNAGLSSNKYLHEVFHTYGLRHRSGGLMHYQGGSLRGVDVLRLGELYGL